MSLNSPLASITDSGPLPSGSEGLSKSDHSPQFQWCHSNSLGCIGQHLVHRMPFCPGVNYPRHPQICPETESIDSALCSQ
jgi:hypothetical protein